jgi:hypothetical protein
MPKKIRTKQLLQEPPIRGGDNGSQLLGTGVSSEGPHIFLEYSHFHMLVPWGIGFRSKAGAATITVLPKKLGSSYKPTAPWSLDLNGGYLLDGVTLASSLDGLTVHVEYGGDYDISAEYIPGTGGNRARKLARLRMGTKDLTSAKLTSPPKYFREELLKAKEHEFTIEWS